MVYWLPCDATNRIVVDDGVSFRQWEPARRVILVDRSHEESAAAGRRMLALLHRNYRCVLLRQERVNGLACDVVAVRPRHTPPRRACSGSNASRHAILRTEEQDAAGQRRYLSFYETFRFVPRVPAGAFSLPRAPQRPAPRPMRDVSDFQAAFARAGIAGRLPAWLPAGYVLVGSAVAGREHPSALLRYGDGLKTISVFEESGRTADDPVRPAGDAAPGDGALRPAGLGARRLPAVHHRPGRRRPAGRAGAGPAARARPGERGAAGARPGARLRRCARAPALLRRRGWDYEQIAALRLYLRAHPDREADVAARLRRGQNWPQIADGLHADAAPLEAAARRWIAAT